MTPVEDNETGVKTIYIIKKSEVTFSSDDGEGTMGNLWIEKFKDWVAEEGWYMGIVGLVVLMAISLLLFLCCRECCGCCDSSPKYRNTSRIDKNKKKLELNTVNNDSATVPAQPSLGLNA